MDILPASPSSLAIALDTLRAGGIVVHATETCYGLACDLQNPSAIAALFQIKSRPFDQPISALFFSQKQAHEYAFWTVNAEKIAAKYLPGPLTLILPLRPDAPHHLFLTPQIENSEIKNTKIQKTIGVRISSHPIAQTLVSAFGFPLSTTSANIHGSPSAYSLSQFLAQYDAPSPSLPDLFLDSGLLHPCPPSTILSFTGESAVVVRQGSLDISEVFSSPPLS